MANCSPLQKKASASQPSSCNPADWSITELRKLVEMIGQLGPEALKLINIPSTLMDKGSGSYTYTDETGKATSFTVGADGGSVNFPDLDFTQITPTQLAALGDALAANGGYVLNDAFGTAQGVMFPV
jgi:hypothetical protein